VYVPKTSAKRCIYRVMQFISIICGICPQKGWLAQPGLTSLKKKTNKLHARFSLGFTFTFTTTPQNPKSPACLSLNFSHPSHPPPRNRLPPPSNTAGHTIQWLRNASNHHVILMERRPEPKFSLSQTTSHRNSVYRPPRSSSRRPPRYTYGAPTRTHFLPLSQTTGYYNPMHRPPRSSSAAALHALFPCKKLF
jgi:hypothetical protein